MAYHGVLIPSAIAAKNIDSYNRPVVSASALDNGNVVVLTGKSITAGEGEVWTAVVPSTSAGLTGLWMVYSGDEVVLTDSRYKGLDPDPRNFFTPATKTVSAFKPALGDIITVNAEALAGTFILNTTTHVNATDTTGGLKLLWGNSQTGSVLSYKLLGVTYFSLATGAIDTQRITAYELECVGV
jgi:hypothetical protein